MNIKKILIISIYYPPTLSIASNRIYSFAKYLDKSKYNIFVHTLDEDKHFINDVEGVKVSRVHNDTILKPISFEKKTNKVLHYAKVGYNVLMRYFINDIYSRWTKESIALLSQIVEKEKIDLVLSSFSPIASHNVALALKKRYPHLVWIADMRDEMSMSPYIDAKTKKNYQAMEQAISENANALTTVSKPILKDFELLLRNSPVLLKEIRNGYDFEITDIAEKNELFTLSYVGNFYSDIKPKYFLLALSELVEENKISEFLVRIIGDITHYDVPQNIKKSVTIEERVSHDEAINKMKQSDALLFIQPNNGRKGVYTGKLFEYLATLVPIVALVDTQDVAAKLIKDCNAGYISEFDNIGQIKEGIMAAYSEWRYGLKRDINIEIIKKHHRREQVKRLEILIEELTYE